MSRIQLALNVNDIDEAVSFYTKLFGTAPAKIRAGYANFAIAETGSVCVVESEGNGRMCLSLARTLITADGGRLEMLSARPAVFAMFLPATQTMTAPTGEPAPVTVAGVKPFTWLAAKEPAVFREMWPLRGIASFIGLTSALGSIGWFTAFALENASYVRAVGQIEVVFTLLISAFYFRERILPREHIGIALAVVGVLLFRLTA